MNESDRQVLVEEIRTHLREDMREVMQEAMQETFTRMGMDHEDPIEMQKDFQHLREWRTIMRELRKKGLITGVIGLLGFLATIAWVGFKMVIASNSVPK